MRLEAEEGKKEEEARGEKDKVATRVWNMKPLGWGKILGGSVCCKRGRKERP